MGSVMTDSPLKQARLAANLSQTELAEMVGVKQGVMSRMELGLVRVSITRAREFSRILGVPVDQLFPVA